MKWKCTVCGKEHDDLPTCFHVDAPWRALVPEKEFGERVQLTKDQCVVDEKEFFIRGHIQIPIRQHHEPLEFSVWSSLSARSFLHMCDRWEAKDRG